MGSEFSNKLLSMYSSIYSMRQDIHRIEKPIGSRDNPIRTCRDLHFGHPEYKSGKPPRPYVDDTCLLVCRHRMVEWSFDGGLTL